MKHAPGVAAAFVVMLVAVAVTMVTGLDYVVRAIKVARSSAAPPA